MKFYIQLSNGQEQEIHDLFPKVNYVSHAESPQFSNLYRDSAITDGSQFIKTIIQKSVLTETFVLRAANYYDFQLARSEIFGFFGNKNLMRVRTDAYPAKVVFVRPQAFEIAPASDGSRNSLFEIPFDNPSGYKQSIMRSDALYQYSENAWQMGMNLPNGQDLKYTFNNVPSIRVYNASDVDIDPYFANHDLRLLLNFTGPNVKLVNQTNGTEWSYNKPQTMADSILLDGINTTLNGQAASVNTDYGYLKLDKGWNDIVVTGATQYQLTFSFPFLYLD
ncbi:phage tail domain-containing protein [Oenococcus sicerae]|uniref:Phage tail family protein n=1 Tax=Oenococcus sicerae TaxID=2203724 RepID=A0AAJ1R9N7_9LACO|nr:phage tail domain-containing protein [Oenococcus sicerae]MDN6899578.1 phage tail family protein [Oenococcus sicerae]